MLLVAACAPLGGCLVYEVASAPVKVAVGTAEVAGSVALGTAKVAGSVAGGALKLAAGLAQAGAVTFVDVASNKVTRVPWREGLTLGGAGDAAKLRIAQRAVDVVRDGKVIYSATNGADQDAPVAPGDVVELGKLGASKITRRTAQLVGPWAGLRRGAVCAFSRAWISPPPAPPSHPPSRA